MKKFSALVACTLIFAAVKPLAAVDIWEALTNNDLPTVKNYVEKVGFDIKKQPVLAYYFANGKQWSQPLLDYLVLNKADIYLKEKGLTAMHYIAINWDQSAANFLLSLVPKASEQKKLVNFAAEDKTTPLYQAVKAKKIDMVRYLLQLGAAANTPDSAGVTPLHLAVQNQDIPMIQLLMGQKGVSADAKIKTPVQMNPYYTVTVDYKEGASKQSKVYVYRGDFDPSKYPVGTKLDDLSLFGDSIPDISGIVIKEVSVNTPLLVTPLDFAIAADAKAAESLLSKGATLKNKITVSMQVYSKAGGKPSTKKLSLNPIEFSYLLWNNDNDAKDAPPEMEEWKRIKIIRTLLKYNQIQPKNKQLKVKNSDFVLEDDVNILITKIKSGESGEAYLEKAVIMESTNILSYIIGLGMVDNQKVGEILAMAMERDYYDVFTLIIDRKSVV